jgi:hypothetical protein
MSAATKTQTLAEITKAETDARDAAAVATAEAEAAKLRADKARERAEAERDSANRAYLQHLQAEHPGRHNDAMERLGKARAALEAAVASGADVFRAYRGWTKARMLVWEVDQELQAQRYQLGVAHREQPPPGINFVTDIGGIFDRLGLELTDAALDRIRDRKASYLKGEKS